MTEIKLNLPKKLANSITKNAATNKITPEAFIYKMLEQHTIPSEVIKNNIIEKGLPKLVEFLNTIPGIDIINSSNSMDGLWWVKFNIDMKHKLSWHIIQNLGFILNYISITERLPTVFMPVSPPPYLNGGPKYFLSWVIESKLGWVDPMYILNILRERLPENVEDEDTWLSDD